MFISSNSDIITSKFSSFDSSIVSRIKEQSTYLLPNGNKSPWGDKDTYGYVHFNIENSQNTYYIAFADVDGHGFANELKDQNIKREDIEIKNVKVDMNKVLSSINSESKYYCHIK